jgi:hypothetical protein
LLDKLARSTRLVRVIGNDESYDNIRIDAEHRSAAIDSSARSMRAWRPEA